MTCKERILSNDYADGVVDFPVAEVDSVEAEVPSVAVVPQEVFKL